MSENHRPRILLIMPKFYDYPEILVEQLKEMGYDPHFLNYLTPLVSLCDLMKWNNCKKSYVYRKLKSLDLCDFEILLVIKGTILSEEHINYIKRINPNIRCILYQWDSMKRFDYTHLIPLFDKVATFDHIDADTYQLKYLPLFHTFGDTIHNKEDIDLLLIGAYQEKRYLQAVRFYRLCKRHGLKFKCIIHTPLISTYVPLLLKGHWLKWNLIRFRPVGKRALQRYYLRSRCFLDVTPVIQNGLSMRIVECYGLNKKIITSNSLNIVKEPLLHDFSFLDLEAKDSDLVTFIQNPPNSYSNKQKLSINMFLQTLMAD